MPIDKTKITKEMLEKALKCETADELVALAKAEGFTLTKEEAEARATSSSAVSHFNAFSSISFVIFVLSIGIFSSLSIS